jgi:branched-subunit amino acid ABC-type transport system permease component
MKTRLGLAIRATAEDREITANNYRYFGEPVYEYMELTRFGGHFIVTEVRGVHNGKATTNVYAGVPAADG